MSAEDTRSAGEGEEEEEVGCVFGLLSRQRGRRRFLTLADFLALVLTSSSSTVSRVAIPTPVVSASPSLPATPSSTSRKLLSAVAPLFPAFSPSLSSPYLLRLLLRRPTSSRRRSRKSTTFCSKRATAVTLFVRSGTTLALIVRVCWRRRRSRTSGALVVLPASKNSSLTVIFSRRALEQQILVWWRSRSATDALLIQHPVVIPLICRGQALVYEVRLSSFPLSYLFTLKQLTDFPPSTARRRS